MPTISLRGVDKAYVAGQYAVNGLDLTIPARSFTCLLGPSGCGKTTTLRMIAGLEHPTGGEIAVDERVLDSVQAGTFVPTEKREMGFVFQSYALWPHLTVRRNVDFGLRLRKLPKADREARVDQAMKSLHIEEYADRYPAQLSGGQQQRVSLARMLAVGNEVLLLDEPLSNLDAALRLEMRAELKRLHRAFENTIVFVTHDQLEAMTLATHVVVMNGGVIQQMAPPMEVYDRPINTFVAEFVGSPPMNMMPKDGGRATRVWEFADRVMAGIGSSAALVGLRPESIRVASEEAAVPQDAVRFTARVTAVLPTGSTWIVTLDGGQKEDVYAVTGEAPVGDSGDEVVCWAHPQDLHFFDDAGDRVTAWDAALAQTENASVTA